MTDNARDVLVRKISAAMADGKDSGGYTTLLDMYAHIALKVVEANAAAQTGRNRDPIYAPDGKTWYQTALDEASKRGENDLKAEAALAAERERCIAICEGWVGRFQDKEIKYVAPRTYAVDAIEDVIGLIRDGTDPRR